MKCNLKLIAAAAMALSLTACSGGFEAKEPPADVSNEDSTTAATAEKVYRVSFNQTETHPQYVALTNLGKRMADATDGKCSLEVFPNETLGNQKDSIELVQAGTVDFAMVAGSLLENFNPDFVVFNLPYTFDDKEHQQKVFMDPELTDELFSSIEDENISVLGAFHAGVRNVYNSKKPINTPADLDGMKIRVIESDTNLKMMELMGGSGTPMGQGEVYTAIQSGVIDGGENNESIFANLKHFEVAKYYSYTRHLMFPDYLITNPNLLKDMDPACSEFLKKDMPTTQKEQGELWDKEIDKSIEMAKEAGAEFNEADVAAFRDAVKPLVEESLTNDFTRDLYAKVREAAN